MNIKGIISISGRPGLFKIISQGKNSVIVESLIDKKKFPAFASEKISAIEDISIFTSDADVKLLDVLATMKTLYKEGDAMNHKTEEKTLRTEFEKILSDYDKDRVYFSDIRKVFQWYNLLNKDGFLVSEEETKEEDTKDSDVKAPKAKVAKATTAKKDVKKLTTTGTKSAKPAQSKKPSTVKTGGSRGK